ncbi:MAG: tRNA (guanosine(46)-N7)-methyltransferase TrmB [Myxococcales bacterium]|nr:tRNA (guanosine(46)-N7)-methyltransferase TrmB [Myxococcales bacterium]MCB9552194.1 tRNA (guanosine(46)-N7)-methyltransferase TrmB [Myxococcales bacterium]
MSRMRGPAAQLPEGDTAWPLLNADLFGSNTLGGPYAAPRPEALPVDWPAVFGRDAPRQLEIGFNRGRFLTALARRRPDVDLIGIEIRRRYCWRIANILGADPEAPRNLRVIWADARALSAALFAPQSLDAVYINFPDPWWKKRHQKRRVVNDTFATELAELLAPGGAIWIKSDVPAIADEFAEAFAAVPLLGPPIPFDEDTLPLTHRETRCLAAGMPIVRYRVERR